MDLEELIFLGACTIWASKNSTMPEAIKDARVLWAELVRLDREERRKELEPGR